MLNIDDFIVCHESLDWFDSHNSLDILENVFASEKYKDYIHTISESVKYDIYTTLDRSEGGDTFGLKYKHWKLKTIEDRMG